MRNAELGDRDKDEYTDEQERKEETKHKDGEIERETRK